MAMTPDDLIRAEFARRRMSFAQRQAAAPTNPLAPTLPTQAAAAAASALGAAPGFGAQLPTPTTTLPTPSTPILPTQAAAQAAAAMGRRPPYQISLPGHQPDSAHWQYEPQPDRSWKMYPPGLAAPAVAHQVTSPNPATPEDLADAAARLAALPGRRTGQYRRAGLTPPAPGYRPPGWPGGGGTGGGGDTGGGDTGGGDDEEEQDVAGVAPYIPGIPTMGNPHRV